MSLPRVGWVEDSKHFFVPPSFLLSHFFLLLLVLLDPPISLCVWHLTLTKHLQGGARCSLVCFDVHLQGLSEPLWGG